MEGRILAEHQRLAPFAALSLSSGKNYDGDLDCHNSRKFESCLYILLWCCGILNKRQDFAFSVGTSECVNLPEDGITGLQSDCSCRLILCLGVA